MRRWSRVALAAIALLLVPAAARGETRSVDIPRWMGNGRLVGPILTADGTAVFAVQRSAGNLDVLRVAPGATQPEKVTAISLPTTMTAAWYGVNVTLTAAGEGFFLYQESVGNSIRCCSWHVFGPKLTWFAAPDSSGTNVALCDDGTCADCGNIAGGSMIALAADATHALIASRCPYRDGKRRAPFIRDLATGDERTTDYPPYTERDRLAGDFVGYGAGFEPGAGWGGGRVVNWRTGATLRTLDRVGGYALLDDGTVIYTSSDDLKVQRWDPNATAPVELTNVQGAVQTAAGGRLLTLDFRSPPRRPLDVWTLAGDPVGSIELPANAEPWAAFDGQRVAFFDPVCTTARLQIWDVGTTTPSRLSPVCGPVTVGSVQIAQGRARAEVTCPTSVVQGCVGFVLLSSPRPAHPRHAGFWLQAGQRRWVPLATRLSPHRCRGLARTRTWQLLVSFSSVYGQQSRTVRRPPAVAC